MNPLVTIGITSYKRLFELKRCIESIRSEYPDEIEILVSEDHSPLSEEIEKMVADISAKSVFSISFYSNSRNLGYDGNLKAIIEKSKGKYVFFMSDDDMLVPNCLDNIITFLRNDSNYGVFYSPFVYSSTGKLDRNHNKAMEIAAGEDNASKYIYDSILFSGLIFRRDYVVEFDASRFKNYNYFQVYLFLQMIYKYGGVYFKEPSVICVGDGENAYGISESSGGNSALANRKSVKSNIEFNKTLILVIKVFDEENGTNVLASFARQYSLHSYSGLSIARGEGIQYYKEYWSLLNKLDIKLYPITKCYYIALLLFGRKISDFLLSGFRKLLKK